MTSTETIAPAGMTQFFAHSTATADRSDWQTLPAHLHNVGYEAGQFAAFFGAQALATVAGHLHDVGKYTVPFQARLCGSLERVDHSAWGARIAQQRFGPIGYLLAYGIAGHHAGLANGVAPHAGAWIETQQVFERAAMQDESRPTRARGLKRNLPPLEFFTNGVAPHAGAWIETVTPARCSASICVAPHAGAWIETNKRPRNAPAN